VSVGRPASPPGPSFGLAYLAVAALVALAAASRPERPSWSAVDNLGAATADALLLAAWAGLAWIVDRLFAASGGRRWQRRHRQAQVLLAALLALFVCAWQLVIRKTGETLDYDLLAFALGHFATVRGAATNVATAADLVLLAAPLAVLLLARFAAERRQLRLAAVAVLLLPWLPLCEAAIGEAEAVVAVGGKGGLYRDRYSGWREEHLHWLDAEIPAWRQGVLTGFWPRVPLAHLDHAALPAPSGPLGASAIGAPERRLDVLFIVLESFRHDLLSAYRTAPAADPVTPFIDSLAAGAMVVEHAYTTIPHTSKALVGIFCGVFPALSPSISESAPGGLPVRCLPDLLAGQGYATAHFQAAPASFEDRSGLLSNMGFAHQVTQESLDAQRWRRFAYLGMDDRALIEPSLEWMSAQRAAGRPFFASLLTILTHHPYVSPLDESPVSDTAGALAKYLAAARYTDRVVRELIEGMVARGLLEGTIVVITGDHGEAFGEHGLIAHNAVGYETVQRVPLLIKGPGFGGRLTGSRHQHTDLLPTVLAALAAPVTGELPGHDLRAAPVDGREIVSACFYDRYCLNHWGRDGLKTIWFFGKRAPEVYDLARDPFERENRVHTLGREALKERIEQALAQAGRQSIGAGDASRR
jgi:arylsulfatase A-like enzyme